MQMKKQFRKRVGRTYPCLYCGEDHQTKDCHRRPGKRGKLRRTLKQPWSHE